MSEDDRALHELLDRDPQAGWRAFVEGFTPALLALIEQAGLRSRDEVMDVYVRACERLSEDSCARLRRHDPAKGALRAWLATTVRHVLIDWMRSRKGRRRVFKSIQRLARADQRVFELYYWRGRTPAEIGEMVAGDGGRPLGLLAALEALERVELALTERQRGELLAFLARVQAPLSLEGPDGRLLLDPADEAADPESRMRAGQSQAALERALAGLPPEDALIVSLRYRDGLSHAQTQRALHLPHLPRQRVQAILARLRAQLEGQGVAPRDLAADALPQAGLE